MHRENNGKWMLWLCCIVGLATPALAAARATSIDDSAVSANATVEVDSLEMGTALADLMPRSQAASACGLNCNPNPGGGGTAFCKKACDEPTAWCLKSGTGGGFCWMP
jgi:hypothetical protein